MMEEKVAIQVKKVNAPLEGIKIPIPLPEDGATPSSFNNMVSKTEGYISTIYRENNRLRDKFNSISYRWNALSNSLENTLSSLTAISQPAVINTGQMEFFETFEENTEGSTARIDTRTNTLTLPIRGAYEKQIASVELTHLTPGDPWHYRGIGHINGLPSPAGSAFGRPPDRRDPDDKAVIGENLDDIFNLQSNGIELEEYALLDYMVPLAEEYIRSQLPGRTGDWILWAMLPTTTIANVDPVSGKKMSGVFTIRFANPVDIDHLMLRQASVRGSFASITKVTATTENGLVTLKDVLFHGGTYHLRFPSVRASSISFYLEQDRWYTPEFGMGGLRSSTGYYIIMQPGLENNPEGNTKFEDILLFLDRRR